MRRRMPADSVFAGAKFWAVWKAPKERIAHEGVEFWVAIGLLCGNRVGQTAQNFGNHGKNEGIILQNHPEEGGQ